MVASTYSAAIKALYAFLFPGYVYSFSDIIPILQAAFGLPGAASPLAVVPSTLQDDAEKGLLKLGTQNKAIVCIIDHKLRT